MEQTDNMAIFKRVLGKPAATCLWLSRSGRLKRADPTQLRLASGREEAYQELHARHQMPWTARGELQKLQKRQYIDISTDNPEDEDVPWTHTEKHLISRNDENDSLRRRTEEPVKAAIACQQAPARRHHKNLSQTGARATPHWKFILR